MKRPLLLLPLLALALPALAQDPATDRMSIEDAERQKAIVERKIAEVRQSFEKRDTLPHFYFSCLRSFPFDRVEESSEAKEFGVLVDSMDPLDAGELLDVLHAFDCPLGVVAVCYGTFNLDRLRGLDLRWLDVQMENDGERIGSEDSVAGLPLRHFGWNATKQSWTNTAVLASVRTLKSVRLRNSGRPLDASLLANIPFLKDLDLQGDWFFRDGRFPAPNLEILRLVGNSVLGEIPELGGSGLTHFELFNAAVTNCAALRNQPLKEVVIWRTPVEDLAFLHGTKSLRSLELKATAVRNLTPLADTGLQDLTLEDNPVDSYVPIAGLSLRNLFVESNGIPVSVNWKDPALTLTTPSPAEETHAESAETAEPKPHAESAEGAE